MFKRITTLRGIVSVRRVMLSQYHVCVQELTIRAPLLADRRPFSFLREKRHHPDGTEAIVITSPKTTIDWLDTARELKESGVKPTLACLPHNSPHSLLLVAKKDCPPFFNG